VLRCSMLFNGTNYCDWVPHMRLHMRGLRLWDFLTSELPCPSLSSTPAQPVIMENTITTEKEVLLADYDDRMSLNFVHTGLGLMRMLVLLSSCGQYGELFFY
jgi:hypothetical protein